MRKNRIKISIIPKIHSYLMSNGVFLNAAKTKLLVRHYRVKTDKINSDIRMILLTDLHSCSYGKNQSYLVNVIKSVNPDVILMAGDIADHKVPHTNTKMLIKALGVNYPCFYVTGNHEFYSGEVDEIKGYFRDAGVHVLSGKSKKLKIRDNVINICGIDDVIIGMKNIKKELKRCMRSLDEKYSILLSHRPEYIGLYSSYDFDMILSGHAHGGQFRIPYFEHKNMQFLNNGFYAVGQGFSPKYAGGRYLVKGKTFIVSRGLSKTSRGIPRLFNPPELVMIDLSKD